MKREIRVGAYGWRHSHWLNDFYPEDLPVAGEDDWRLAYYSNEFSTVLVPAEYWLKKNGESQNVDCKRWLDDVNTTFQFIVECNAAMLEQVSFDEISRQLITLQAQLSALVLRDDEQEMSATMRDRFCDLATSLGVNIFTNKVSDPGEDNTQLKRIWQSKKQFGSDLALFEDDLTDLRLTRTIVDEFMSQTTDAKQKNGAATIIVCHPDLLAKDLNQFRAVLEIMGH